MVTIFFLLQIFFNCRIAKERVHLAYKHPELLLDLMKKGTISTSLACNDLEVNIRACHDQQGDICGVRDNRGISTGTPALAVKGNEG